MKTALCSGPNSSDYNLLNESIFKGHFFTVIICLE